MTSITNVKLQYFNARGRGELIRYILNYAAVTFQDDRIQTTDWQKIKPTMPLLQVPVFSFDDADGKHQVMVQSGTIIRSLARWYGLNGQNDKESRLADEAYECLRDIADMAGRVVWERNPEAKEQLTLQMKNDSIPRNLSYLEQSLKSRGGKFMAGGQSFTYADLAISVVLENICKEILIIPNVAFRSRLMDPKELEEKYPGLNALKKSVEEHPKIATYLASRVETPF